LDINLAQQLLERKHDPADCSKPENASLVYLTLRQPSPLSKQRGCRSFDTTQNLTCIQTAKQYRTMMHMS